MQEINVIIFQIKIYETKYAKVGDAFLKVFM